MLRYFRIADIHVSQCQEWAQVSWARSRERAVCDIRFRRAHACLSAGGSCTAEPDTLLGHGQNRATAHCLSMLAVFRPDRWSDSRTAVDIDRKQVLRESRETALVQPDLNVAVPDALQVDHGRGDVAVPHPLLKRADVDAILQVPCRVGMAEFV